MCYRVYQLRRRRNDDVLVHSGTSKGDSGDESERKVMCSGAAERKRHVVSKFKVFAYEQKDYVR